MSTTAELWRRIARSLQARRPEVLSSLREGASASELDAAEQKLHVHFPPSFRESWLLHDGESEAAAKWLCGEWRLMSLEEIVAAAERALDVPDELVDVDFESGEPWRVEGPVRAQFYNRGWIPVLEDQAGNYRCLDLSPSDGGTLGQVIEFLHDVGDRRVVAQSLDEILARLTDARHEAAAYSASSKRSDEEQEQLSRDVDAVVAQIDKLPSDVF